jgi:hypothetical protein
LICGQEGWLAAESSWEQHKLKRQELAKTKFFANKKVAGSWITICEK